MNKINQAIIFNSGIGKRMGPLTQNKPKALLKLINEETILSRQIRILKSVGIKEIIVTTGPFHDQIEDAIKQFEELDIKLIHNPLFDSTNNIYSLWLIKDLIKDMNLILHGDLVFNESLLIDLVSDHRENLVVIDKYNQGHHKDFKAFIHEEKIINIKVSEKAFDNFHMQPIYKFEKKLMNQWLVSVKEFITNGNRNNYMEDALNNVILEYPLNLYSMKPNHFVGEIDTQDDYKRVNQELSDRDFENQIIDYGPYISFLENYIKKNKLIKPLIVHGKHFLTDVEFMGFVEKNEISLFSDYSYNPSFGDVLNGVRQYQTNKNDSIIAIAGGSGIDVAKAIKYFNNSPNIDSPIRLNSYVDIPLAVIPTTAGTGSESTTFSVIYYEKKKQSIEAHFLLPDYVVLDENLIKSLPIYQRKSTLLDAFCQAIESTWSINATKKSLEHAIEAIIRIQKNYIDYINGKNNNLKDIIIASNLAGKAINISKTTMPHALSYGISKIKQISHGHSVSLNLLKASRIIEINWDFLPSNVKGNLLYFLKQTKLDNISYFSMFIQKILESFDMDRFSFTTREVEYLINDLNFERLKNFPVYLSKDKIKKILNY